jgi:hypothetical protein
MDFINYKSQKIKISLEPQTGVLGRPFRLSGISKNTLVPQKFTNGIYKSHWTFIFKYLDEQGEFFAFKIGYEDEVIEVVKNYKE